MKRCQKQLTVKALMMQDTILQKERKIKLHILSEGQNTRSDNAQNKICNKTQIFKNIRKIHIEKKKKNTRMSP